MIMDMLVNLYNLNEECSKSEDFEIKRILSPNIHLLEKFILDNFWPGWASEAKAACYKSNPSCFIATVNNEIVGFACYDATTKGFFGPLGVAEKHRKKGIAKQLILRSMYAMKEEGYAYAIIGGANPKVVEYYKRVCGAIEIPHTNDVYSRMV